MENAKKIVIQNVSWSVEAEKCLSDIKNQNIKHLRGEVRRGKVSLFQVSKAGETIGFYALRVEKIAGDFEGVVCAGSGRADFNLVDEILPIAEKQFLNCKTVRIHTARAGLVRKLLAAGYEPQEFVMKKVLHG